MKWTASIEKVSNGYIVKLQGDTNGTATYTESKIFEDENEREQNCLAEVFVDLLEHFAVFNSKHNKTRLEIEVVKQHEDS
jgi:hypothetical protein